MTKNKLTFYSPPDNGK